MPADPMARLEAALRRVDLDRTQAARMLGVTPRTVGRWLRRDVRPRPEARERLRELLAVLDHISKTLQPQAVHDWLFMPNPLLVHHKPADLLREGRYRELLGAIDQLAEGVFVWYWVASPDPDRPRAVDRGSNRVFPPRQIAIHGVLKRDVEHRGSE